MQQSWYTVIPVSVLYSKELTDRQKLIVAVIVNNANEKGECSISNAELADLFSCTNRTIKVDVSKLVRLGYVQRTIMYKPNSLEFESRTLKVDMNLVNGEYFAPKTASV